ncbi:MAG TPA: hypothetical protein VF815_35895 [Myxococcaceae bacterium]|jgi:hypothetical protein
MTAHGQVYLADLLDILHALSSPGPEVVERLLPMLHLGKHKGPRDTPRQQVTPRAAERPLPPSPPPPPPPAPPASPTTASQNLVGTRLIRLRRGSSGQPPAWSRMGAKLAPEEPSAPIPVPPLIEPRKRTPILAAALATHVPEGRPLIEPMIQAISRALLLTELPRRSRPTLRRGVQVLVDVGEGLIPFDADVRTLVEGVRRSVGQARTEVLSFTGSPLRGVGTDVSVDGQPWRPPMQGTPLLILTDLGLGGPATSFHRAYAAEWARFAESAHHAQCPPVVLVPYPPERWPRTLRGRLTLLHWDRGTTAGAVRHRRGARPRGTSR